MEQEQPMNLIEDESPKLLKSRKKLLLNLQESLLKRKLAQKPVNKVANVVVIPKENTDVEAIFNESHPIAENDLAGNYGVGPKEGIIEFFGDNVPLFTSTDIMKEEFKNLCSTAENELGLEEETLNLEIETITESNNTAKYPDFDPLLEAEMTNIAFELFGQ